MHQEDTIHLAVDYPQENEKIVSNSYSFRVSAPLDSQKVEISIDGYEFKPLRQAAGYWWYDWSNFSAGVHEAVVRIQPQHGRALTLQPRRFFAQPSYGGRTLTQYSVLVPNEPGKLAFVTELIQKELANVRGVQTVNVGDGTSIQFVAPNAPELRRTLENHGFAVRENQVFQLQLPENNGGLPSLARGLADKGINVLSLYGLTERQHAKVVVSVDRPEQAQPLFESLGISILN